MRNPFGVKAVLTRAYVDNVTVPQPLPSRSHSALLDRARPVHEVVPVDVFVPGCPPSADTIFQSLGRPARGTTVPIPASARGSAHERQLMSPKQSLSTR